MLPQGGITNKDVMITQGKHTPVHQAIETKGEGIEAFLTEKGKNSLKSPKNPADNDDEDS